MTLQIWRVYFQRVQLYHLLEELRTLKKFWHLNKGLNLTGIKKTAASNAKPVAVIYAIITLSLPELPLTAISGLHRTINPFQ